MADENTRTEDWKSLPWKSIQQNVFRHQKRIYQAAGQGDVKRVHDLHRLLLRSWSARCLAVRRVTQDNAEAAPPCGKRTPGVDGVASLTPRQRIQMLDDLRNLTTHTPAPLRRVYIPKPGKKEMRGLSIPTMLDRAYQALVKLALEPEWEAQFEPNSYGFRPGRSPHDAIEAIFNYIRLKPKYALDADITECFDRISHDTILDKLHTIRPVERWVRRWLQVGILDHGKYIFPETGTAQGGPLSPWLANVALHGLETALRKAAPSKAQPGVIRFADDFVILHHDCDTLKRLITVAQEWLAGIGLELNAKKPRITHALEPYEGTGRAS
jgi:RNA-directed DNA polymerase